MCVYSIIVPAYNEEQSLRLFYDAVIPAFEKTGEPFEVIFVNDGSIDNTWQIIKDLARADSRIKGCRFSRNFGQQSAILCGMEKSVGQAVIVMDADLQDPPEVALEMIEKWKEGYEIVHGKRKKRDGESLFKRATAKLFYRFTRKITGLDIPQNVGDFKLYDRKAVDALLSMPERDRLLRVQTAWIGFSQTFVEFDRPKRIAGETHYTLKKMVKLAKAGVFPNTNFTLTLPLKMGVLLGIASVSCFITFAILCCCGIFFGGLTAWLFPTLGILTSLVLASQGLSNVHTHMIYREVQNRPRYIVAEEENFKEETC